MESVSFISMLLGAVAVILLVLANAFFVATEFALVAARETRMVALAEQGDRKARLAHKAIQSLDRYISATQLGITLASLGLGWIGERTLASALISIFEPMGNPWHLIGTHLVAGTIAFTIITVLHIVLGELAPKALALLHPEETSRWVAAPIIAFTVATNPFIWVLNGAANATLRIFGMRAPTGHERVHQPEEIVMLVKQLHEETGDIDKEDVELIEGVFEFTEKNARDVMTPRTDVMGLDANLTVEEAASKVGDIGRSRYPVIRESLDDIVGIVHAKDLLACFPDQKYQKLESVMRGEPLFVPGSREVEDLLADMKRLRQHLAVVLDEYGGTAGIVSMEDILEEIVGKIFDEYDDPETPDDISGDGATIPGNMEITDANDEFDLGIESQHHLTVGGYVFGTIGRLPTIGDTVSVKDGLLRVTDMDGRRITQLRLIRPTVSPPPSEPAP